MVLLCQLWWRWALYDDVRSGWKGALWNVLVSSGAERSVTECFGRRGKVMNR